MKSTPGASRRTTRLPRFSRALLVPLAVAASAALVFLSFPDPGQDWLIWVSLVPLFLVARGAGGWRGFLLGWLTGILLEGSGFHWVFPSLLNFTEFTGHAVLLAIPLFLIWILYSALSWGALGWLLGRARRPANIHVAIAIWVAVEAYFPRLFPWHLGGALHEREWLRQGADIAGTSGLSYWVLLVNALLYLAIEWRRGHCRAPVVTAAIVAVLIIAAPVYGAWRCASLRHDMEMSPTLRVGLVQPVVEPEVKHDRGQKGIAFFRSLLLETRTLAEREKPDLVVWPEGMNYLPFRPGAGQDPLEAHRDASTGRMVFDDIPVPLVVGGGSSDASGRFWNTAAYIVPAGETLDNGFQASLYHKNHLMLLGERLPFQDWLPDGILRSMKLSQVEAGTENPVFLLRPRDSGRGSGEPGSFTFRVLICYEATLPDYLRQVSDGVDFLVNVTEDIWYGRSAHIGQHVSVIRMRAVENRVPVVRCTNIGPSGVVDITGELSGRTEVFAPVANVVMLQPGRRFSLYRQGGFVFPLVCLCLGLALAVAEYRRRSGRVLPPTPGKAYHDGIAS